MWSLLTTPSELRNISGFDSMSVPILHTFDQMSSSEGVASSKIFQAFSTATRIYPTLMLKPGICHYVFHPYYRPTMHSTVKLFRKDHAKKRPLVGRMYLL